jgi:hypothetical protein
MITYQAEQYSDVLPELAVLYPEHYEEVQSPVSCGEELDLNWDQYKHLDNARMIQLITCRSSGELIGYILYIISRHLHVKTCLTAYEDIYFLRKQHRKGRTGIKLFQFAEQHLKSLNVNKILCSTKVHQDNSKLFEYLGYSFVEKLFSKYI